MRTLKYLRTRHDLPLPGSPMTANRTWLEKGNDGGLLLDVTSSSVPLLDLLPIQ